MLEQIITTLQSVDPIWIYFILFFFAYIENVFPPSPSDVAIIVGASLLGNSTAEFIPIVLITSLGSSLGFITVFLLGKKLGDKLIRNPKIKFINQEDVNKVEAWFQKYGYSLVVANRFLPGTRAIISFFCGANHLSTYRSFLLASTSALLWNALIIYVGFLLGQNLELIDYYLTTYSNIILFITAVAIIVFLIRYFKKKK